ncbi:uncharacterized protein BYT42DRAFT_649474 [Radiomyces spectabilis]|uniref:uncharacterized protein n=1 Tax=Radiomyces spectabilis TaxID=64574 RepID=UPI00221E4B0B|nr:uncharacterized protein BYT42DRAFT_649474 [Radiomyces spectabilis]KAI8364151.1 hypothetical protein BYT42DRAFT_649474 [Radiomyces spectabilis]
MLATPPGSLEDLRTGSVSAPPVISAPRVHLDQGQTHLDQGVFVRPSGKVLISTPWHCFFFHVSSTVSERIFNGDVPLKTCSPRTGQSGGLGNRARLCALQVHLDQSQRHLDQGAFQHKYQEGVVNTLYDFFDYPWPTDPFFSRSPSPTVQERIGPNAIDDCWP